MRFENPLITVLTLSYNSPDLYASIDSVLCQDYGPIQYILVDDGSAAFDREKTEAYIRLHAGRNISSCTVMQNGENEGTVRASNRGLRKARGAYIFNLAGDDLFADPQVLSDWVRAFQATGALAMTARRDLYDAGLQRRLASQPTARQIRMIGELPPERLFERIAAVNFIFGCCTARSRECVERYGEYDERYRLIEDHSKNLFLLRNGVRFYFFDRTVVKYRGGGISSEACYNAAYERDADAVFQREVLPHTRFPRRQKRRYERWKRGQALGRRYQELRRRFEGRKGMLLLLKFWHAAHAPVRSIRRIPAKVRALLAREEF